jgi:hypothetical protein
MDKRASCPGICNDGACAAHNSIMKNARKIAESLTGRPKRPIDMHFRG